MGRHAIEMGPYGRELAARVAARRVVLGMTQADLSDRLAQHDRHLGRQTIAEIETCRRRVDVDDLAALAQALDVEPAELLGASWQPYLPAARVLREEHAVRSSAETLAQAFMLFDAGYSYAQIAHECETTPQTVSRWLKLAGDTDLLPVVDDRGEVDPLSVDLGATETVDAADPVEASA